MTKKTSINLVIDAIIMIILIVIDQISKAWAVSNLKDKPAIPVISGILELNYLENRGAAFGMLQNQRIFFIFVAVVILVCIVYILIKAPTKPRYLILHILLTMIAAGAIGNMIDRCLLNYVVDFIYFKIIDFPIFNFADICVTLSTLILVIMLLFVYKEKDLQFLSFRTSSFRTLDGKSQMQSQASAVDSASAVTEPAKGTDKEDE